MQKQYRPTLLLVYIVKYKCELSVGVHSEVLYKCELSVGVHSEVLYKCELSVGVCNYSKLLMFLVSIQ